MASVSCIYGLGSPEDFISLRILLRKGGELGRNTFLERLVDNIYERNDYELKPGRFRVRGDVIDVMPAYMEHGLRVEFFGDTVEAISEFEPLYRPDPAQAGPVRPLSRPTSTCAAGARSTPAIQSIKVELEERVAWFESRGQYLEAQRIKMRTNYDLEMLQEMGFCNGIENYSLHFGNRKPGDRPFCLIDFFPKDFLLMIDESHATVPQIGGMYNGDRSRKQTLVDFGFRLPSALDNRPQSIEEFDRITGQTLYVSATPVRSSSSSAPRWSPSSSSGRPGLLDPEIVDPPDQGPGRGPDRRDQGGGRRRRAGAGHDADQAPLRGPDDLPARGEGPGRVPALRHRHDRARSKSCATCGSATSTC